MIAWLSANLINILLIAVIALITGLLIRGMIRDKKAGKSSCGGNCADCGACGSCGSCSKCGPTEAVKGNGHGT
ncbi:MAG: FeoB-associated Cys-rich membrane protein [Oscillospiraceae bacterium]|nr:FeoB-associated Cys-rich membrane protein [Oscillospiraceae bacterium]